MNDVLITTERLKIWDHVHKHLNNLYALLSDDEVMYYLPELKVTRQDEAVQNLLTAMNQRHEEDRKKYFLCVQTKDDFQYIGEIGSEIIREDPQGRVADLGFFLRKDVWNQGYATEAAKAMINYMFDNARAYKIETGCLSENAASERVLIKCGLTKDATKTHTVMHDGREKQRVEYFMINPDIQ